MNPVSKSLKLDINSFLRLARSDSTKEVVKTYKELKKLTGAKSLVDLIEKVEKVVKDKFISKEMVESMRKLEDHHKTLWNVDKGILSRMFHLLFPFMKAAKEARIQESKSFDKVRDVKLKVEDINFQKLEKATLQFEKKLGTIRELIESHGTEEGVFISNLLKNESFSNDSSGIIEDFVASREASSYKKMLYLRNSFHELAGKYLPKGERMDLWESYFYMAMILAAKEDLTTPELIGFKNWIMTEWKEIEDKLSATYKHPISSKKAGEIVRLKFGDNISAEEFKVRVEGVIGEAANVHMNQARCQSAFEWIDWIDDKEKIVQLPFHPKRV